jgi:hypothetical protein
MAFPIEEIPDDANLFRKIHRTHYDDKAGVVSSAAFKQERMSVNWEKYKTAKESVDANSAAVVALVARNCRELRQTVEHTPIQPNEPDGPNQAHAEVCGKKTGAVSHKLRDKATTVWLKEAAGLLPETLT